MKVQTEILPIASERWLDCYLPFSVVLKAAENGDVIRLTNGDYLSGRAISRFRKAEIVKCAW